MRPNPKIFAALALLSGGSAPWACEARGYVDDIPFDLGHPLPHVLTQGRSDGARFEPWYEACDDLGESSREEAVDESDARRELRGKEATSKSGSAAGNFVIPSTAAYGWVALRHTRGPRCGSAKVYFDGRFVESIELYAVARSQQCERLYYMEDHSATEHRFEARIEGEAGRISGGYACLDNVGVGW